jgi:Flp pilus assembly protein TadG
MQTAMTAGGRRRRRGQSLTEFALVVPVLMLLIFGVLDGALLMFSVGTARYAAGEGSRLAATLGNAATTDAKVVQVIRDSISQTSLFTVDEVDIYKLDQDGSGNLTPDPTFYNKYRVDGTALISPEPWPAVTRNVGNGTSDFLGVTINYTYTWKAGFFSPLGPIKTKATYYIRLEPLSY